MVSKNSTMEYKGNKRYISATLSLLYMGLGQIYNGQYIKGIGFLIFWTAMLVNTAGYFIENISPLAVSDGQGGYTIGSTPGAGNDHSLFLLVFGIVAVGLLLIVLGVYIYNIYDAYKNGARSDLGFDVPSFKNSVENGIKAISTIGYLVPALLTIAISVIFPIVFTVAMAFTNYNLFNSPPANLLRWVGFANFEELLIFARGTFFRVFGWTVVWALLTTFLTYALGLFLAIILDKKEMKGRNIIRTILLVPWAIPPFVTLLIWNGLLNVEFGHINRILTHINVGFLSRVNNILYNIGIDHAFWIERIDWLGETFWARVSVIGVNLWISFPFCMAVCLGILQSIDKNLYKAAEVDGATKFQQFKSITLPLVLRQLTPLLIMQFAFQFNNFNIVFLLTGGGPAGFPPMDLQAGSTDILISWIYKLTADAQQYSIAAAVSIVIFIVLAGFSAYQFSRTKAFKEEGVDY